MACSLEPGDYIKRLDEFRRLFATSLLARHREPRRLHRHLNRSTVAEPDVRDLLRREQECCPFFTFTVAAATAWLGVEASVPAGAEALLDELEQLAVSTREASAG
jgi:hypothetical protein